MDIDFVSAAYCFLGGILAGLLALGVQRYFFPITHCAAMHAAEIEDDMEDEAAGLEDPQALEHNL